MMSRLTKVAQRETVLTDSFFVIATGHHVDRAVLRHASLMARIIFPVRWLRVSAEAKPRARVACRARGPSTGPNIGALGSTKFKLRAEAEARRRSKDSRSHSQQCSRPKQPFVAVVPARQS
jgi:hypothetical protein